MKKYGGQLADYRLNSKTVGISQLVSLVFMRFLSEFLTIMMILQMKNLETTAVLILMMSVLFQLGYLIQIRPYSETAPMIVDYVNLVTQLYLMYLMLLFTDFTTYKISEDAGNQFLYAVLVNIGVNLIFSSYP